MRRGALRNIRFLSLACRLQDAILALGVLWLALAVLAPAPARALQPIVVSPDDERIEITALGELYEGRGDTLQVETAAGEDAAVGRMAVRAATPGTNPNWIVFAITNPSDKPVERWIAADRYTLIGSGAVWPDLDARRIEAVTPSIGFVPERIKSDRADLFRITVEPGKTITYVAELSSERFARIYLWKQLDYELKVRDRLLFNGVLLGLTGLLAVFLTAIFAANHKLVFPAAALVAWCALGYLCVDFGFFHKLFQLKPEDNAVYRAAAESALAASLVIFLHVFLRLALWHGLVRMLVGVWMLAQLALIAVAVIDPRLAATFARLSFLAIGGIGAGFTMFLAIRGQDRALSLIPTWLLFIVWIFAAGVALTGRLSGDMVVSSLVAGMVLILLLIGFTVTQYAFRSIEPVYGAAPSEMQLRSLAVDSAGAAVWEWSNRRDEVKVGPAVEAVLGLQPGELSAKVEEFSRHLHPADRERFRVMLWSIQERSDGRLRADFRMRHADNSYRWFEIEAARVHGSDPRAIRCVGLMRDVTDSRRAHERLVHDAVHCSLTGLPNRELLMDRIAVAIERARSEPTIRPQVLCIGLDKFRTTNASFGLVVGDSLLLTVARRLQRHLGPQDTLARLAGDQFVILMPAELTGPELSALAERIRRSLRSPIKIAGQEIVLTGSIGIASYSGRPGEQADLLKDAEIAMYRAKRGGADRVEFFKPEMRADREERSHMEAELRRALEKGQVKVLYLPIVYLPTEELAGFEAIVRWEHAKYGLINPGAVEPVDERSDLIAKIGSYVLMRAVKDASTWHKVLPRAEAPLFVSVNVSSKQFFRQDLIQEVRHILGRNIVTKGTLRLEVTERLVMQNPEQASEVLEWIRGAGAELSLDEFGTGYSSVAFLQRFPFDTFKVDRELVQECGARDGAGASIIRSVVALAHELGKKVVAEGVESAEDSAFLRSIGCEYAEGVYFGSAHSEGDVLQLLKAIRKSESRLQPRGLFKTKSKRKGSKGPGKEASSSPPPANGGPPAEAGAAAHAGDAAPGNGMAGSAAARPGAQGGGSPRPPGAVPRRLARRGGRPQPPPLGQAAAAARNTAEGAPAGAGSRAGAVGMMGVLTSLPANPLFDTSLESRPVSDDGQSGLSYLEMAAARQREDTLIPMGFPAALEMGETAPPAGQGSEGIVGGAEAGALQPPPLPPIGQTGNAPPPLPQSMGFESAEAPEGAPQLAAAGAGFGGASAGALPPDNDPLPRFLEAGAGGGQLRTEPPPQQAANAQPQFDYSGLPPAIAASLARLAGRAAPQPAPVPPQQRIKAGSE